MAPRNVRRHLDEALAALAYIADRNDIILDDAGDPVAVNDNGASRVEDLLTSFHDVDDDVANALSRAVVVGLRERASA